MCQRRVEGGEMEGWRRTRGERAWVLASTPTRGCSLIFGFPTERIGIVSDANGLVGMEGGDYRL